jgi:lysophospholipase L1-like esterase
MLSALLAAALPIIVGVAMPTEPQKDPDYLVNGGFENGLAGWSATGDIQIETQAPLAGMRSVRLGPYKAKVSQRYTVSGLRIIWFGASARFSSPHIRAQVRVRCLDARGRTVMDLNQEFDPQKAIGTKGTDAGIYFKTQALTTSIVVSIEKTNSASGNVIADSAALHDYDHDRIEHAPQCDLDRYMQPVWHGDTVVDESVLLLSIHAAPPAGRLLFRPTQILSVTDSTLGITYKKGKDFDIDGNTIFAKTGSKIPTMNDTDFPKGEFPWLSVAGKHVMVTYEHTESWSGPMPAFVGKDLPATIAKLKHRRPITIVALGDSITLGINVSGYREEPPYMPTWPDLFAGKLKKSFGYNRIKLYNTALGGMTAQWGRDNAKDAVALLNPDLVIVAFGMNDFWSASPAEFGANTEAIIRAVRSRLPKAEFILVSSIRFDPSYTADPTYVGHMTSYREELRKLTGPGVALLDLTTLSEYLYKAKSAKDLLADPMHPDDFLARLFAQSMAAMLTPPELGERVN